jgi:hypothetical protein
MNVRGISLVLFGLVVALNTLGIAVDAALAKQHMTTITEYADKHPWLGWLIVAGNGIGFLALGVHFFPGR